MTGSIVLDVCQECGVSAEEFFSQQRSRRLVAVRQLAIARLRAAGFNYRGISRAMRRDYSTIMYWVHPEYRQRRVPYYAKYWAQKRAERTQGVATAS